MADRPGTGVHCRTTRFSAGLQRNATASLARGRVPGPPSVEVPITRLPSLSAQSDASA